MVDQDFFLGKDLSKTFLSFTKHESGTQGERSPRRKVSAFPLGKRTSRLERGVYYLSNAKEGKSRVFRWETLGENLPSQGKKETNDYIKRKGRCRPKGNELCPKEKTQLGPKVSLEKADAGYGGGKARKEPLLSCHKKKSGMRKDPREKSEGERY